MNPEDFNDPSNWGGITEPSAVNRAGAATLYEMYDSYVQAGFDPSQSMQLICTVITATIHVQGAGED